MRLLWFTLLSATTVLGRTTPSVAPSIQPDAFTRALYRQVVLRNPNDLLTGRDWTVFAPYFSQALRKRMDEAKACEADHDQHDLNFGLEKKLAGRFGIFTGGPDRLVSFTVGNPEHAKDGSLRVFVTVEPSGSRIARVTAILISERGQLALDDVIYLDDNTWDHEEDRRSRFLSHYLAAGCNGPKWIGGFLPKEPGEFAKGLYANVGAHPTSGIPTGEDWKIFAPYLSSSLLHKIVVYDACIADEIRYYAALKGPPEKLASLDEFGLFSGGDEEEVPRTVKVEKINPQRDGSVRVSVTLGLPEYQMEWPVVDVLVREQGRLVLKDVDFPDLFFHKGVRDSRPSSPDAYLSKSLTELCHGGRHWTGYR